MPSLPAPPVAQPHRARPDPSVHPCPSIAQADVRLAPPGDATPIPTSVTTQQDPLQASTKTVNVELILDSSGSMGETLPSGETRMEAANGSCASHHRSPGAGRRQRRAARLWPQGG